MKVSPVLVGDDFEAVWNATEAVVEPAYLVKLGRAGLFALRAFQAFKP